MDDMEKQRDLGTQEGDKSAHRKLKPFEKNVNLEAAAISTGNTQEDTKNQNLLTQVPGNKSIRKNS